MIAKKKQNKYIKCYSVIAENGGKYLIETSGLEEAKTSSVLILIQYLKNKIKNTIKVSR